MAKVTISSLAELIDGILELRGIRGSAHELIREDLLQAELQGKRSHGLGKLLLLDSALGRREGEPRVVRKAGAICLIDGRNNLGHVIGQLATETGVEIARQTGISLVSLSRFSRYGRLSSIVGECARQGMVAILMNTGGPAAVAPYGSRDPILGTNPIAFAFPLMSHPLIIDFSTSKSPWGEIRQALLENRALPSETFLDKNGDLTIDPNAADAVLPFGGHKGAALCLAIEILVGMLTKTKMGAQVETEYDLGALLITIDPAFLGLGAADLESVGKLLDEVRSSRPRVDGTPVRIPGDQSSKREAEARYAKHIEVDNKTYALLVEMSQRLGVGLEDSKKTN